ncbi:MAG: shikimate kinase [Bacteriovoracaceae bacterium]
MARCEKILIAGFSGSGKSTLLEKLKFCGQEGWKYYDLDQEILRKYPQYSQLSQVIADIGWEKFRLLERQGIELFLKEKGKGVLALGGGAFTPLIWQIYGNHPKIMFCYLYASFEDCWQRLVGDSEEVRPLALKGKNELGLLYQQRLATYQLIPWKLVNDGQTSLEELAQKFWDKIQ